MRSLIVSKIGLLNGLYLMSSLLPLFLVNIPVGNYLLFIMIPYLLIASQIVDVQKVKLIIYVVVGLFMSLIFAFVRGAVYDWKFLLIDLVKAAIVICSFSFFDKKISFKSFLYICCLLVVINILGVCSPRLYIEGRYEGILRNVNMSVYLVSFSIFFIFFYFKNIKSRKHTQISFLFFLILFLIFSYVSQSRSYLIAVIAFLFLGKDLINYRFFIPLLVFLFVIFLIYLGNFDFEKILVSNRMSTKESSFLTRLNIYELLFDKIVQSRGLPNGPNSDQIYIESISKLKGMHAHNDILKYLYNYGFFFIIFIGVFVKGVIRKSNYMIQKIALLVFYISTSLHGYLFVFLLLHPFFLTLKIIDQKD